MREHGKWPAHSPGSFLEQKLSLMGSLPTGCPFSRRDAKGTGRERFTSSYGSTAGLHHWTNSLTTPGGSGKLCISLPWIDNSQEAER